MKHTFVYDEASGHSMCRECGYIWGEKPHQSCPMDLNKLLGGKQNGRHGL